MAASFAAHVAFLLVLLYHAAPVFVTPSDVAPGVPHSSGSCSITYLAPTGAERPEPAPEQARLTLHPPVPKQRQPQKLETRRQQLAFAIANAPEETARGGSPFGRVPGSPLTGDEAVPAFPVIFPDPPVSHSDLPAGVQGDVIVEVTIDAQGNVVETRLLQGIGYGIEQKVLAVLQRWRFHPAMRNGVTIASQHIVHFHYPG
ncbi:MAG TPA: TonB family protein [Candidatus Binatia bacterium]|nr:TonB family protein [Candidatus Binatia bacterium]